MKSWVLIFLIFVTFGFLGIAGCSAADVVTSPDDDDNIFSDETKYIPKFLRPILTPILLFIADLVDGTIIHGFVLLIISVITIVAGFFGFTSPKRRKPSPIPEKIISFLPVYSRLWQVFRPPFPAQLIHRKFIYFLSD